MKAVIEIGLEMDGQWKASKRETLIGLIMSNPQYGCWEVDDDLLVSAKSMACRITRSSKPRKEEAK